MEVGIHWYLDFSLFLSHLKYKGLQSREGENIGTSKQLFALRIIQRAIIIWNLKWDTADLAEIVF